MNIKDFVTLDIPGEYLERRNGVEYPEFKKYSYYSRTAKRDTEMNVLLPVGYDENRKYPVMYILHGYFDDETWMARDVVKIPEMSRNLALDGKAEEMIVVLPYIYCDEKVPRCTGMDLDNSLRYDNFINDFLLDVIPFVDKTFATDKSREGRALTGFSMGGRESLFIGFKHPELFGWLGAVDPAPGLVKIPESPAHPGQMSAEELKFGEFVPKVVYFGSSQDHSEINDSPMNYHAILTKNGVEHFWHHMPGHTHNEMIVKPHLYNFMRLIFKEA